MPRLDLAFVLATATALLAPAALAQDVPADFLRGSYVHVGVFASHEADEGRLWIDGFPIPGADFVTELTSGAAVEVGLRLSDYFAISVSGTTPMTTSNVGSGTLAGYGNLGNGTVGYYALTGHVHVPTGGPVTPYFGGGLGYMHVFDTTDGVISNMEIESAPGGVVQAGVELAINENVGLFLDAKQFFISTEVTGDLGPSQAVAQTRVDPWLVSAGLSANF